VISHRCIVLYSSLGDVGDDVIQAMTPNSFGTHNNVITVQKSDFEAFEALGVDSLKTGHHDDNYYIKYGLLDIMSNIVAADVQCLISY